MALDPSKEMAKIQRKTALIDNLNYIPPFSGEGNSVSFGDFYEKLDSFANMFGWDDEEKKFALLSRLSGAAARLLKIHKIKSFEELVSILKNRYSQHITPDVQLNKLMNFKQTPAMTVQDFYDRACDLSLNSLVIEGIQDDVVEKSRKALLHSVLLNNLSPEIRKGVIARNPKTPEEVLQIALLEEKAYKSVNPFYNSYESSENIPNPQNVPCAAVFSQKSDNESHNRQIQNLKSQIDLLAAKIDSLVEIKSKEVQNNFNQGCESSQTGIFYCFKCGLPGHYARNCTLNRYTNDYGRGFHQNPRGRGQNSRGRNYQSENYRGNNNRGGYRRHRGNFDQGYETNRRNRDDNASGETRQDEHSNPTTSNNALNV